MLRKLFVPFIVITLLFGSIVALLHFLLYLIGWTPKSLLYYLPVIIAGNVLVYIYHFRKKVREVKFKGAGSVTVPTVFLLAMMVSPPALLNWIALKTDVVKTFGSLREAALDPSPFFTLKSFTPIPDKLVDQIEYDDNTDDDGNLTHTFDYTGLVPVRQESSDSPFTGWIEFTDKLTKEGTWTERDLEAVKVDFQWKKRNDLVNFRYDSIAFFSALDSDLSHILSLHGINEPQPFFMHASLESASSYRKTFITVFGGFYVMLTIFFIGAVKFGHYEAIDVD
ncbi:MAG: hypothetical protein AB7O48_14255 [Cyclobacteriaceae bacterium]